MAENESLDLGKAPRWQQVHRAVMNGEPTDAVVLKARKCLYRTLKALKKIIPLNELLTVACDNPNALRALTGRCGKGREFANLFSIVAVKGMSKKGILRAFIETICDRYFGQIEANSFPSAQWSNLPDLRCHLAKARELLAPDIDLIAHNLAEDTNCRLRIPRSRNGSSATNEILNESLLGVPRQ